jgi:hypothetical protein
MDSRKRPPRSWEEEQELKDDLIERADCGKITGAEADAEAIRLGLGSFSHQPGPDEYRPEAVAYRALPMAVAWIAYLDLEDVRNWSAPYREQCYDWHWRKRRQGMSGVVGAGWQLQQRSRPTLALLSISASYDLATGNKTLAMGIGEARAALWIALQSDCFRASGVDVHTQKRVEIVPLDWLELKWVEHHERDEVRSDVLDLHQTSRYRDVLIPSAPLMGLWRKPLAKVEVLPPIMQPTGFGYIPLFCAAQWIATEGGTIDIDPTDVDVWRLAYGQLVDAISSGAVKVVGVEGHQNKPVPAHLFVGIRVDYPYADPTIDMILSSELVLRCYPYVDEEHWRNGFDDALVDRGGDRWVRLSVEKSGVRSTWPFGHSQPPKSGTPGRPTSAHLFKPEMERRAECGELSQSLAAETRYLS